MSDVLLRTFASNPFLSSAVLERAVKDTKAYVLLIMPRSGSTWLTEQAISCGKLGAPQEWFNEDWIQTTEEALGCLPPKALGVDDINDYVSKAIMGKMSNNKAWGIQLSYNQIMSLSEVSQDISRELIDTIPCFYLRRKNIIRQAMSLYRASASGVFHSYQLIENKADSHLSVSYDYDRIVGAIYHLVQMELRFEEIFSLYDIKPHRFFYEDLVADLEGSLKWLVENVTGRAPSGLTVGQGIGRVRSLSDQMSIEWETRFRAEAADDVHSLIGSRPELISDLRTDPGCVL
jgi:LPS sulfotransferase NodH